MFEATADTVAAVAHAVGQKRQRPVGARRLEDVAFFDHVDAHADEYVARLAEFVAIPSVSAEPERRGDVERAVLWYQAWCDRLGATTRLERVGVQTLQDGTALPLPPVLLASWGDPAAEPDKPTLVVYGHLDVQPADKADGWNTEPFTLTEVDGRLHGRGASDDKGDTHAHRHPASLLDPSTAESHCNPHARTQHNTPSSCRACRAGSGVALGDRGLPCDGRAAARAPALRPRGNGGVGKY